MGELIDTQYLKTLIESDKVRKDTAQMMYDFLQVDVEEIKGYINEYMLSTARAEETVYNPATRQMEVSRAMRGLFTAETAALMPKYHRDIVNKILNNLCTAYHSGVDRYLVDKEGNINEEQTELLNEIYKAAGVNRAQKDWYKKAKFFNICEVKPVWRKSTQRIEFDIWTPNFFTVWSNPENYLYKDLIMFDTILVDAEGNEKDVREVWTKDEHYYLVMTGSISVGTGVNKQELPVYEREPIDNTNKDMVNPYGIIPSQELRFKTGQDYYGIGMLDLVEDNIWHDIRENNALFVEMFQGLGIVWAVNAGKQGTIAITPYTVIALQAPDNGAEPPAIHTESTNAPLADLRENIQKNYENIASIHGLSGQSATTDNSNAPGISKAFDMEELELQRLDDKSTLTEFEENLYIKVRTIQNKEGKEKLDENLTFVCDFIDKSTPLNMNDLIAKWTFELDRGLKSPVDYLIAENPDLTEDQAKEQLKKNEQYKKEEEPAGISTNGKAANQPA